MNTERLIRKAVTHLKLKWGLPESGFIAGGSIANLVWQYVSGTEAKINDIDVFIESEREDSKKIFEYQKKEVKYSETYRHLINNDVFVKNRYKIYDVTRNGIYNYIHVSKNTSPEVILESFDINAACAGYSIHEDKVFYTDAFNQFLETGQLKIVNLMTPSHTAIRLIKKKYDLSASLDERELRIIQLCLSNTHLPDFNRFRFQEKYAELAEKFWSELSNYFELISCVEISDWLEIQHQKVVKVFKFNCVTNEGYESFIKEIEKLQATINSSKYQITTNDILFYFREIDKDKDTLHDVWSSLLPFFKKIEYLDTKDKTKVNFVANFVKSNPGCIENLKKYTLSQQFNLINMLIEKVMPGFDMQTVSKIIETYQLEPDKEIDDFEANILGLSVRRKCEYTKNDQYLPF